MTCTVDGCDRQVKARGWCPMHYQRWLRQGTTDVVDMGPQDRNAGVDDATLDKFRRVAGGGDLGRRCRRILGACRAGWWGDEFTHKTDRNEPRRDP